MRMRLISSLSVMVVLASQLGGCIAFYKYHDVQFKLVDAETNEPIEGATIDATYLGMWILNPPKPAQAVTSAEGMVALRAANLRGGFQLKAAAEGYTAHGWRATITKHPVGAEKSLVVIPDGAINTLALYAQPVPSGTVVLPPGFEGLVRFPRASPLAPTPEPGQREFTVQVGDDGIAHVPHAGVAKYVRWGLRTADGTPLSWTSPLDETSSTGVARYHIGDCDQGRIEYVGTDRAAARALYIFVNRVTFPKEGGMHAMADWDRANAVWDSGLSAITQEAAER